MTPERYRECLKLVGATQRGMARWLRCSDRLTREWAHGVSSVPREIAVWLEACAALRGRDPRARPPQPPPGWRRDHAAIQITHDGHRYSLNRACQEAGVSRASVYYRAARDDLTLQAAFNFVKRAKQSRNELDKVRH